MNAQLQNQTKASAKLTPVPSSLLQRKCACGNHTMSGECEECSKKKQTLQRASLSSRARAKEGEEAVPPIVHEARRSPGQPLDPATRAFFEPRFGHDFTQVRVHTDAKAAESAQAVNALAYTVGRDVVFGTGQFAPGTTEGQKLLAHELIHFLQQSEAGRAEMASNSTETAEREADTVAHSMVATGAEGGPGVAVAGGHARRLMCKPNAALPLMPQQEISQDAFNYLRALAKFVATLRTSVLIDLRANPPVPIRESYIGQFRLHEKLNQDRIARFLEQARSKYEGQIAILSNNDPLRLELGDAYLQSLREICQAADVALTVSNGLDERRVAAPERAKYVENLSRCTEARPAVSVQREEEFKLTPPSREPPPKKPLSLFPPGEEPRLRLCDLSAVVNPLSDISTFQSPGGSGWWGAKFGCFRDNCTRPHRGWDIYAPVGTDIMAVEAGSMMHREDPPGYGHYVRLRSKAHPDREHVYGHLSARQPAGSYCAGEKLGETGTSGNAQANRPHLHFRVESSGVAVDPSTFFAEPTKVIEAIGSTAVNINKSAAAPCVQCAM